MKQTSSQSAAISASMPALLRWLRPRETSMVRLLKRLVRAESPSDEKASVDRLGRIVAGEWRRKKVQ